MMKKFTAAVLSLLVVGGALPAVQADRLTLTSFAEETAADNLVVVGTMTYKIDNNQAELVSCDPETAGNIYVPDKLNGLPVTAVGEGAFKDCLLISSVYIPQSVTSVGSMAFSGCIALRNVTLPDGITALENLTFFRCKALTKITIPDSVKTIGNTVFYGCEALTDVIVPASVEKIGESAFCNCKSLETITFLDPECNIFFPPQTICSGEDAEEGPYFNGTIRGFAGSTAQSYAEKNGYSFEAVISALGDVNYDGTIDATDASRILAHYAATRTGGAPLLDKAIADVNGDDTVDSGDASAVLKYYAYTMSGGKASFADFIAENK